MGSRQAARPICGSGVIVETETLESSSRTLACAEIEIPSPPDGLTHNHRLWILT